MLAAVGVEQLAGVVDQPSYACRGQAKREPVVVGQKLSGSPRAKGGRER
jgi:hypothetical protein